MNLPPALIPISSSCPWRLRRLGLDPASPLVKVIRATASVNAEDQMRSEPQNNPLPLSTLYTPLSRRRRCPASHCAQLFALQLARMDGCSRCSPSTIGKTSTVTRASIRMLAPATLEKVQDNPVDRPKHPFARNFLRSAQIQISPLLSHIVAFRRGPGRRRARRSAPLPSHDFRMILPVLLDPRLVVEQPVADRLLRVGRSR